MYEGSLCICCMSTDRLVELFTKRKVDGRVESYAKTLAYCLNLKVSKLDGHEWICYKCALKLQDFMGFKRQTIVTISILSSRDISQIIPKTDIDALKLNDVKVQIIEEEPKKKGKKKTKKKNNAHLDMEEHVAIEEQEKNDVQETTEEVLKYPKEEIQEDGDEAITEDDVEVKLECDEEYVPSHDEEDDDYFPIKEFINKRDKERKPRKKKKRDSMPYEISKHETVCRECGEEFPTNMSLKIHYNSHFGTNRCEICNKGFITRHTLKVHMHRHTEGNYICEKCGKEFKHLSTLKGHKRARHNPGFMFKCPECGAGFHTYVQRMRHENQAHGHIERRYPCRYCGQRFEYAGQRAKHIQYKHEQKVYQCPLCEYKSMKHNLRSHMFRRHGYGRGFTCDDCGLRFISALLLEMHRGVHTGVFRFACKLCDKQFRQKQSLMYHIRSHIKKGQYRGEIDYLVVDKKLQPAETGPAEATPQEEELVDDIPVEYLEDEPEDEAENEPEGFQEQECSVEVLLEEDDE